MNIFLLIFPFWCTTFHQGKLANLNRLLSTSALPLLLIASKESVKFAEGVPLVHPENDMLRKPVSKGQ